MRLDVVAYQATYTNIQRSNESLEKFLVGNDHVEYVFHPQKYIVYFVFVFKIIKL